MRSVLINVTESFKEDDNDPVYRGIKEILKDEYGLSIEDVEIHHNFTENGRSAVVRK